MHHLKRIILLLIATIGLAVFIAPVRAQEPAREQLEMLTPTPEVQPTGEQAEEPAAEPSEELGPIIVLKRAPRYQPFRVYSDSQYVYNSNVLLAPSNRQEDEVYAQTLGASFSPRLIKGLASTIYVRHQFIRYLTLNNFDFDAQTAGVNFQRPVRNWFILSGGFEASRFILRETDKEFLKDFDVSFGIRRGQYLHERVFLYYGYQGDWMPTSPSNLSRVDNALYAGVNLALMDKLTLQLAYRLRAMAYYQDSRFDYDHSLNASLIFKFNDYANVRAFVNYANNDSDNAISDYEGLTAGCGLGLSLRF